MNEIKQKDFLLIKLKAVSRVYLKAIIKATPGEGNVAGAWDIKIKNNEVVVYNEEFGDIVRFLEEGTKEHIIKAKNKKFLKFKKPKGTRKKSEKIPGNVAFEKDGYIFAKAVRHPGIEARLFIHKILNDPSLSKEFDKVFEVLLKEKLAI